MKRKNWLLVLLILLCLAVFYGYRAYDRMRTDTKAPEIQMDEQIPEVSVGDPKSALLQGITATDKTDGDVTASLVVESITLLDSEGNLQVTCAAFDSAGNVAKAQRQAKCSDYESPRFTLSAPLAYTYGSGFDVLSTVGATDVVDGDIQHRVRATSLDDASIATKGSHYVQFQVSNSLGDTVTQVFPVEVYDAGTYDADLSLQAYLIYLPKGASFEAKQYLKSFTWRGEETSLQSGLPANFSLRTKGEVQTQTPGTYSVEYRVTYTEPNETNPDLDRQYTAYSKLIVVVEG